jgi:hypothetical protein
MTGTVAITIGMRILVRRGRNGRVKKGKKKKMREKKNERKKKKKKKKKEKNWKEEISKYSQLQPENPSAPTTCHRKY